MTDTPNTAASAERVTVPAIVLKEAAGVLDCEGYGGLSMGLLNCLSTPAEDPVGTSEPQVGRAVYERIEKLVAINPKPGTSEWIELDYLSDLTESVEEVGGYDGPKIDLAHPAPDPAGLVEALEPFRKAAENLHPAAPDTNIPLAQINVGQWRAFLAALTAAQEQGADQHG